MINLQKNCENQPITSKNGNHMELKHRRNAELKQKSFFYRAEIVFIMRKVICYISDSVTVMQLLQKNVNMSPLPFPLCPARWHFMD